MQIPFDILVCGRFPCGSLTVLWTDAPRESTAEIDALIADEWERQTAAARRDDRVLFNGDLLRYVRHAVRPDASGVVFELTVGPSCYRDFVGTNLYNRHRKDEWSWQRFSNPVGTTATVLTGDGRICYGLRSRRVAWHAGCVHTFGGALEGQDRAADGSIDAFAALARELHEELGLRTEELGDLVCVGLIRDREIHQPELLLETRVELTAAQLRERWESAEARDEHDDLVTLPDEPDAVVPFIQACGPIAPVATGALLLHGRQEWGENWFCRALREVGGQTADTTATA